MRLTLSGNIFMNQTSRHNENGTFENSQTNRYSKRVLEGRTMSHGDSFMDTNVDFKNNSKGMVVLG